MGPLLRCGGTDRLTERLRNFFGLGDGFGRAFLVALVGVFLTVDGEGRSWRGFRGGGGKRTMGSGESSGLRGLGNKWRVGNSRLMDLGRVYAALDMLVLFGWSFYLSCKHAVGVWRRCLLKCVFACFALSSKILLFNFNHNILTITAEIVTHVSSTNYSFSTLYLSYWPQLNPSRKSMSARPSIPILLTSKKNLSKFPAAVVYVFS